MRRVEIDDLSPGDIVANPVVNDKGMVILPKGIKLTPSLIGRLDRWGVTEAEIEGEDPNAPPPKTTEELLCSLDERFSDVEDNQLMMALKAIAKEHILARDNA